jgi:hypothetical protein
MKWMLPIAIAISQGTNSFAQDKASSLRTLIIYDSSYSNLKESYAVDAQRMSKSLETIAYHAKLRFCLKVCEEKEVSLQFLQQKIKGISSSSRDVVFVYYAGEVLVSLTKVAIGHLSTYVRHL